jgi:hypothetical protein
VLKELKQFFAGLSSKKEKTAPKETAVAPTTEEPAAAAAEPKAAEPLAEASAAPVEEVKVDGVSTSTFKEKGSLC